MMGPHDILHPEFTASTTRLFVNHGTVRRGRACVPCHERKVRCVPATTESEDGLPCARCIKAGRVPSCIQVTVAERIGRNNKRKRADIADQESDREREMGRASTRRSRAVSRVLPTAPTLSPGSPPPEFENVNMDVTTGMDFTADPTELDWQEEELDAASIPSVVENNSPGQSKMTDMIAEEDSQLESCQQMAHPRESESPTFSPADDGPNNGQVVIEYHDGVNPVTILSDVFAQQAPKRLVRILLKAGASAPSGNMDNSRIPWIDARDARYLSDKEAFTLPSRTCCERILKLYFECIYPYAPILNRNELMRAFDKGLASPFLMQCIVANTVPYLPAELLAECGFSDHYCALKAVFSRAKLLFDFGVERNQLPLLQGSIMLGSLQFSFGMGNDYGFWFNNAFRLATRMGLHRNSLAAELSSQDRALFRRIWWVLYCRDTLLTVSGLTNMRQVKDDGFDTTELTEGDWNEPDVQHGFEHIVPSMDRVHKLYLIENSKLCHIYAMFLNQFRAHSRAPSISESQQIERSIAAWHESIPEELRLVSTKDWTTSNFWSLVLMAMSYRSECVLYRTFKSRLPFNQEQVQRNDQKQLNAMMHLDAILEQIMLNDLTLICPLSIGTCASTVVAMHIETALSSTVPQSKRVLSQARIQNGLSFLRIMSKHWNSMHWTLRMFDVILQRTGLLLCPGQFGATGFDLNKKSTINPFQQPEEFVPQQQRQQQQQNGGLGLNSNAGVANNLEQLMQGPGPGGDGVGEFDFVADRSADSWIFDAINFDIFAGA